MKTSLGTVMVLGALSASGMALAQDPPNGKTPPAAKAAPAAKAPAPRPTPAKPPSPESKIPAAEPNALWPEGAKKEPTPNEARIQALAEKLAAKNVPGGENDMMWERLRGSSIRERILALEAFVREHPDHDLAAVLYEEATLLRELAGHRLALGDRPPVPANARIEIPTIAGEAQAAAPPKAEEKDGDLDDGKTEAPKAETAPLAKTVIAPEPAKTEAPKPDAAKPDAQARGVHRHDGGYVHFAFGPSWLRGKYTGAVTGCAGCTYGDTLSEGKLGGSTMNAEMALGWSIADGVVLGVRGTVSVVNSWSFDNGVLTNGNEVTSNASVIATAAGMFDWFPMPDAGLHLFVSPGYATGRLADGEGRMGTQAMHGLAMGTGLGYEGFVSDQWSIGLQARVDLAWLSRDLGDTQSEKLMIVSPGLQATFTYN